MKKVFILCLMLISFFPLFCNTLSEKEVNTLKETSRVDPKNGVDGYVYFAGFDFPNYAPETGGIQEMLDATLTLLQNEYGASGHPFVFVGHSQGGLRALAMSTYLKRKDPVLYKQLRGVITLSGIDKGLALLENNGDVFRSKLYNDVRILTNGVYGVCKVFDYTPKDPVSELFWGEFIKESTAAAANTLAMFIVGDWVDGTKGYAYPILHGEGWDQYAQVRDMVPQSSFIQNNVLVENSKIYQHKNKKESYKAIEWRSGWLGIKYPCIVTKYRPVYIRTNEVFMKVDKDLPIKCLAGTISDTTTLLDEDTSKGMNIGFNIAGGVFATGAAAHYVKTAFIIGLFTNSIPCAIDCTNAASWCFSYKNQISDLLGGTIHDGLVTLSSQQLPSVSCFETIHENRVLNNLEVKEYPLLNHKTMDFADALVESEDEENAKTYANTTVTKWLEK